jgi:hypothetical protein
MRLDRWGEPALRRLVNVGVRGTAVEVCLRSGFAAALSVSSADEIHITRVACTAFVMAAAAIGEVVWLAG